jgi:hypothetical protein
MKKATGFGGFPVAPGWPVISVSPGLELVLRDHGRRAGLAGAHREAPPLGAPARHTIRPGVERREHALRHQVQNLGEPMGTS